MMKKQLIYITLALATICSGCSKWLDISASTDVDREDLISSDQGFKQMLYGVYLNLTDAGLYGHEMTFGMLESCANNYTYSRKFSSWAYTDASVRPVVDAAWSKMYNTIANINSILNDIDGAKDLFSQNEWQILKGEALALRAFTHFDIMRMFAPNYVGNEEAVSMPYVLSYERVRYPHITSKKVMEYIETDLKNALALLKEGDDPAITSITDISSSKDQFTANRRYRMNYWAVRALQARVALYKGDKTTAMQAAKDVLDSDCFRWVNPSDFTSEYPDRIMISEVIFALNVSNLSDYNTAWFKSGLYAMADTYYEYTTKNLIDDVNDYRYLYMMMEDAKNRKCISAKYNQDPKSYAAIKQPTIPLIRKGEMQLILAECQLESNLNEAIKLVRELRYNRGYLGDDRSISSNITADELKKIIIKEFRKETYMEGQTFFNYKRNNITAIPAFNPWSASATTAVKLENYTMPLPESEKEYGNIPNNE